MVIFTVIIVIAILVILIRGVAMTTHSYLLLLGASHFFFGNYYIRCHCRACTTKEVIFCWLLLLHDWRRIKNRRRLYHWCWLFYRRWLIFVTVFKSCLFAWFFSHHQWFPAICIIIKCLWNGSRWCCLLLFILTIKQFLFLCGPLSFQLFLVIFVLLLLDSSYPFFLFPLLLFKEHLSATLSSHNGYRNVFGNILDRATHLLPFFFCWGIRHKGLSGKSIVRLLVISWYLRLHYWGRW